MRIKRMPLFTDEAFKDIVASSLSWKDIAHKLGYHRSSSSRHLIKARVEELGLSTEHFNNWCALKAVSTLDLLIVDTPRNNQTIKKRIVKEKILPYRCVMCGLENMYNMLPLVLHLDHINGNPSDNRLLNLRFLCPNCHSQTSTYSGKNNKRKVI